MAERLERLSKLSPRCVKLPSCRDKLMGAGDELD
jgi:hypothetical protein